MSWFDYLKKEWSWEPIQSVNFQIPDKEELENKTINEIEWKVWAEEVQNVLDDIKKTNPMWWIDEDTRKKYLYMKTLEKLTEEWKIYEIYWSLEEQQKEIENYKDMIADRKWNTITEREWDTMQETIDKAIMNSKDLNQIKNEDTNQNWLQWATSQIVWAWLKAQEWLKNIAISWLAEWPDIATDIIWSLVWLWSKLNEADPIKKMLMSEEWREALKEMNKEIAEYWDKAWEWFKKDILKKFWIPENSISNSVWTFLWEAIIDPTYKLKVWKMWIELFKKILKNKTELRKKVWKFLDTAALKLLNETIESWKYVARSDIELSWWEFAGWVAFWAAAQPVLKALGNKIIQTEAPWLLQKIIYPTKKELKWKTQQMVYEDMKKLSVLLAEKYNQPWAKAAKNVEELYKDLYNIWQDLYENIINPALKEANSSSLINIWELVNKVYNKTIDNKWSQVALNLDAHAKKEIENIIKILDWEELSVLDAEMLKSWISWLARQTENIRLRNFYQDISKQINIEIWKKIDAIKEWNVSKEVFEAKKNFAIISTYLDRLNQRVLQNASKSKYWINDSLWAFAALSQASSWRFDMVIANYLLSKKLSSLKDINSQTKKLGDILQHKSIYNNIKSWIPKVLRPWYLQSLETNEPQVWPWSVAPFERNTSF